jgi:hypothetical protein
VPTATTSTVELIAIEAASMATTSAMCQLGGADARGF